MTLIEHITEQVATYNAMEIIPTNLEYLMGIRKNLSYNAYLLGKDTARAKKQMEAIKAQRKIKYFKHKAEGIKSGDSAAKAETFAEVEISELREQEANLDGLYGGYKIILDQCNECLKSIQQDISQLKLEYKNEL